MIPAPLTLTGGFGGFKPKQSAPWHLARLDALLKVREFDLEPGMIVCRLGNAVARKKISFGDRAEKAVTELLEAASLAGPAEVYVELPFSPIIAKASGSEYSHAAMVYRMNGKDPVLLDVGGDGTKVLDFVDWVSDVRGEQIEFLRYIGPTPGVPIEVGMQAVRELDPDFDPDFAPDAQRLYCTEGVYHAHSIVGIDLGPPTPFRYMPGWTPALEMFATLAEINPDAKVFTVGHRGTIPPHHSGIGLLASPLLQSLGGLRLTKLPDGAPVVERWQ